MKIRISFFNTLTIALFVLAFSTLAAAQATRTWVSGVGDDVNPCSRTAPCKTFAGAISKTAAAGEINALDPGGFGTITITKSLTIDGSGTFASILAAGTTGVTVNAGVNDVVTLRGLSINGAGTGITGVRILQAKTVIIEDCVIFGFVGTGTSGRGISDVRTSGVGNLYVTNTTIRNNSQSHIVINPTLTATVNAAITNVRLENSTANSGLAVLTAANVLIRDSVISGNVSFGIVAEELGGAVDVNVENCSITNNGTGVSTTANGTPFIRLSNTMITGNSTGLTGLNIFSFGNNRISGNNVGNGPPSGGNLGQQ